MMTETAMSSLVRNPLGERVGILIFKPLLHKLRKGPHQYSFKKIVIHIVLEQLYTLLRERKKLESIP